MAVFPSFLQGYQAGEQLASTHRRQAALLGAGQSAAAGDYAGGKNALLGGGYFEEAGALDQMGQRAEAQTRAKTVGAQVAGGDVAGGQAAALSAGDFDMAGKIAELSATMDENQRAQAAQNMEGHARLAYSLKGVPVEQRAQAAMRLIQGSPYDTPEFRAQLQQNQQWDDVSLDAYAQMSVSAAEQFKQASKPPEVRAVGRQLVEIGPDGPQVIFTGAESGSGFGKPPSGYRYTRDGNLEAVPGGPAAAKVATSKAKAEALIRGTTTTAENVLAAIARAKQLSDPKQSFGTTGAIGAIAKNIPGNAAHDLSAAIDTIVANIGFDRLQEMRNSSPTGGALGAVTERELSMLQAVITSLRQSQSNDQFRQNLQRVEAQYKRMLNALNEAYAEDYGDDGQAAAPSDDELLEMYGGQ